MWEDTNNNLELFWVIENTKFGIRITKYFIRNTTIYLIFGNLPIRSYPKNVSIFFHFFFRIFFFNFFFQFFFPIFFSNFFSNFFANLFSNFFFQFFFHFFLKNRILIFDKKSLFCAFLGQALWKKHENSMQNST